MDSKKSNKIREIVRLQQILKKWKKLAANAAGKSSSVSPTSSGKSIKFLKKTLSFSEKSEKESYGASSSSSGDALVVPKGYLAVCVGKELRRFVIPTEYLAHQAFSVLLREAEEEFGFQQEGVLKIPCEVPVFERILKMMEDKREVLRFTTNGDHDNTINLGYCYNINSPAAADDRNNCDQLTPSHHHRPQVCR